jgi:2-C-methyl-D-erythritol 4-phosphate cytidylyltransferase/2-C-methyl-D-erythritol 2,4-cyclodiphosphate synthase
LKGHSDADVALHALTDAIMGAIGAGDIGSHFPPSDDQWKGASSDRFLKKACDLVSEKGGSIVNVDLTIICERPKIGPHREKMRERIAQIAGIDVERVSVKGTTTEKLGFTGRSEGIAAQAVTSIKLMNP